VHFGPRSHVNGIPIQVINKQHGAWSTGILDFMEDPTNCDTLIISFTPGNLNYPDNICFNSSLVVFFTLYCEGKTKKKKFGEIAEILDNDQTCI
jgi:hypothetical protein